MYLIGNYTQRCDARHSAACAGEFLTSLAIYLTVCSNIQVLIVVLWVEHCAKGSVICSKQCGRSTHRSMMVDNPAVGNGRASVKKEGEHNLEVGVQW
jgi:hypothetical protein